MKYFGLLLITISIFSCNTTNKEKNTVEESPSVIEVADTTSVQSLSPTQKYTATIGKAHHKEAFLNHKAVSFTIDVNFDGQPYLDAKVTMLTDGTKIRIDKKDGSTLLYDGEKVYLCPETASDKSARFDMFTWSYFFTMPYKLEDPGTHWELQEDRTLDSVTHQTARLTFDKHIGDSPEDWYVTYRDATTHLLKATAYIVSFGNDGDLSKAESDPHAVHYKAFTTVDGIPFATQWEFYGWTIQEGMKAQLGEATVSDITFLPKAATIFETPEKAKEIHL